MHLFYVIDFVKLVEIGNFSATADELYISQSSLSKHIQSLEKVLGVKLIHRSPRKISLTEGGELFLPYAKQLQNTFLKANKELKGLITKEQQNFILGFMPTMTFYNIMDMVAKFKMQNPQINVTLFEILRSTEKEIKENLFSNECEIVFCDSMHIKSDRIEKIDYCNDHMVAILHREHRLAASETIATKQLRNEPLILMNKRTTTYHYSCSICEKAGFTPNIFFLGSHVENVLDCVSNNMGIALLMKKFTGLVKDKNVIIKEINPTVERTISLGRISNRVHSMASNLFWDYFSSHTMINSQEC